MPLNAASSVQYGPEWPSECKIRHSEGQRDRQGERRRDVDTLFANRVSLTADLSNPEL